MYAMSEKAPLPSPSRSKWSTNMYDIEHNYSRTRTALI